jgi:hypothetical protein
MRQNSIKTSEGRKGLHQKPTLLQSLTHFTILMENYGGNKIYNEPTLKGLMAGATLSELIASLHPSQDKPQKARPTLSLLRSRFAAVSLTHGTAYCQKGSNVKTRKRERGRARGRGKHFLILFELKQPSTTTSTESRSL